MTPKANKIIVEYESGLRIEQNRIEQNRIEYISLREILGEKLENKYMSSIYIFLKAYDYKKESLYVILIKFGVKIKLVRLVKISFEKMN